MEKGDKGSTLTRMGVSGYRPTRVVPDKRPLNGRCCCCCCCIVLQDECVAFTAANEVRLGPIIVVVVVAAAAAVAVVVVTRCIISY